MNHEEWLEQAEIYGLGALDGDELIEFEAHLASGCLACENRLRETRETLTLLPRALPPLVPPSHVRARLLGQIAAAAVPAPPVELHPRRHWAIGASALAAAGLLIVLGLSLYRTQQELHRVEGVLTTMQAELLQRENALHTLSAQLQSTRQELQRMEGQVVALQAELARREETLQAERQELRRIEGVVAVLQTELAERQATLRLLSTPQVRLIRLTGLAPSPRASAQLLWHPAMSTGLLLTSGLPHAPPDRIYELWAIAGDEPIPAGIFAVDEGGHGLLRLPSLPKTKRFNKFAVTLEPAGGVAKPTGPMHLLGSL